MDGILVASFIVFVVSFHNAAQVSGSGFFEIRIEEFVNDHGRLNDGKCCEGLIPGDGHTECQQECKTAFNICLSHYRPPSAGDDCTFGSNKTGILGGNTIERDHAHLSGDNVLRMPFDFTWPVSFSLVIEATHDKGESAINSELIARMEKYGSITADSNWRTETQTQSGRTLRFSYRVLCAQHYFGRVCANFCRPRDDGFGHWACNNDGEKVCLEGWQLTGGGNYCLKPICRVGCNSSNGYCDQPGECRCRPGWTGDQCNECMRYPGCQHGTCTKSFECECEPGWGGMLCNNDLNYCVHHKPCRNNARCRNVGLGTFSCECKPGFTGKHCEISQGGCYTNPCNNDGTCLDQSTGYVCLCPCGYTGPTCDARTGAHDGIPCKNGGSCVPRLDTYYCECPPGTTGRQCEHLSDPCSRKICLNGGRCEVVRGYPQCKCSLGFTGNRCQIDRKPACKLACGSGECVMERSGPRCKCKIGFVGENCGAFNRCSGNPCQNNGECESSESGYSCHCTEDYGGVNCETPLSRSETEMRSIIVVTEEKYTQSGGHGITVGLLSVLIVALLVGLVVCLSHPFKRRSGYLRGVAGTGRSISEAVVSIAGFRRAATSSTSIDNREAEENPLETVREPEEFPVKFCEDGRVEATYHNTSECPRYAKNNRQFCRRWESSLPTYQEACDAIKLRPSST